MTEASLAECSTAPQVLNAREETLRAWPRFTMASRRFCANSLNANACSSSARRRSAEMATSTCHQRVTTHFRVLSERQVAYLDVTGSGNETSAHLAENGRITIMFCAFDGPPNISRLFGRGTVVLPSDEAWSSLSERFSELPAVRQIVLVDVTRVQTSCGYGVPLMRFVAERDFNVKWAAAKGEAGLAAYQREKNTASIDGLPTHLGRRLQKS